MISSLRLQGFKPFHDTGVFPLPALTVLVGKNSGGKSSVIQSLLLFKQIIEEGMVGFPVPLDGSIVALGSFASLVHDNDPQAPICVSFEVPAFRPTRKPDGSVGVSFCIRRMPDSRQAYIDRVALAEGGKSLLDLSWQADDDRYTVRSVLSTRKAEPLDVDRESVTIPGAWSSMPYSYGAFRHGPSRDSKALDKIMDGMQRISIAGDAVSRAMGNLFYLGPLRREPQPYYLTSPRRPNTVGSHGEYALELLMLNKTQLEPLVSRWLQRFGMGSRIDLQQDQTFNLFLPEVVLPDGEARRPIAGVGFGLSQVLPLIVQGFISPVRSTILAEQPEIHLHPAAQVELGNLLVEFATHDRQLVVETHSEHLVLSVQRNIAEGRIPADAVAVYVVEQRDGASVLTPVEMSPDGLIDWPQGFFEEGIQQQLELARLVAAKYKEA